MLKFKQYAIIAVAAIAILTAVIMSNNNAVEVPMDIVALPLSNDSDAFDAESYRVNLSELSNQIVNSDAFQIKLTKSMKAEDTIIVLSESVVDFNNMTGDCHTVLLSYNYCADMWNNVDTGKGVISVDSYVTNESTDWVPINSIKSDLDDSLFYNYTYDGLVKNLKALLSELEGYSDLDVTSNDVWKITKNCDSGNTIVSRNGNVINMKVSNPDGTDISLYTITLGPNLTEVPDVCTYKTSSIAELQAICTGIKEM